MPIISEHIGVIYPRPDREGSSQLRVAYTQRISSNQSINQSSPVLTVAYDMAVDRHCAGPGRCWTFWGFKIL